LGAIRIKMKEFILIIILTSVFKIGYSQFEIPQEIGIRYYIGGDYRHNGKRGVSSDVDSALFIWNGENRVFESEKVFFKRDLIPYVNWRMKRKRNLNKNPSMNFIYHNYYKEKHILELIKWTKVDNYRKYRVKNEALVDILEEKYWDTIMVPKDFSILYFGIDSINFDLHYNYFKALMRTENETGEELVEYETFNSSQEILNKLMQENLGGYYNSSYSEFVIVSLNFSDRRIRLSQSYLGGGNIKWRITEKGNEPIEVVNPRLNDLVIRLLPEEYSQIRQLGEYRDLKRMFYKLIEK
jgi:hypothetical protein